MSDLLNLLDANLEDLADLQKFQPFPAGSYKQQISWEIPDDDEVVIVVFKLKNIGSLSATIANPPLPLSRRA